MKGLAKVLVAAPLVLAMALHGQAQNPRASSSLSTVEGIVRDTAGKALVEARVCLQTDSYPTPVQTTTNASGMFTFLSVGSGTYRLRIEKMGFRSVVLGPLLMGREPKHFDIVLQPASAVPEPASASSGMELEDKPNFTVAGITDWSGAGGHGSDANLRTSEDLTRETVALKKSTTPTAPGTKVDNVDAKAQAQRLREQLAQQSGSKEHQADIHRSLGDIAEQLGDPLTAVHEYEQAVQLNASEQNYFAWGAELLFHRAIHPAAEVFGKGSAAYPKSARMLAGLGAALYAGDSYEEAAQRLCAAADLAPADPTPYLFLGKMDKAAPVPLPCVEAKLAQFLYDRPEDALANYYYAMALWKRQRDSLTAAHGSKIEVLLKKAVSINPKLDDAYLQLGVLDFVRGDVEQSLNAYQAAITANPQLAEAHYRLGLAYKKLGEQEKAHEQFQLYQQVQKTEAATVEQERRELRQFLIVLKDQPAPTP